jgi:hypothetical protein
LNVNIIDDFILDLDSLCNQIEYLYECDDYTNLDILDQTITRDSNYGCINKLFFEFSKYGEQLNNEKYYRIFNNIKYKHANSNLLAYEYNNIYWQFYNNSLNKNYQFLIMELEYGLIDELYEIVKYKENKWEYKLEKYKRYLDIIYDNIANKQLTIDFIVDVYQLQNICKRDNNINIYYTSLFFTCWNQINNGVPLLISSYITMKNENKEKIMKLEKENMEYKNILSNISIKYNDIIKNK